MTQRDTFVPTPITEIQDNPFQLIGREWMLVTAGEPSALNTMTAAWGGLGYLWNRDVCFCFVRPNRYTYEFTEKHAYFSLCFFPEDRRETLKICGSRSGRDVDKLKLTGLEPLWDREAPYFAQARLAMVCKKIYYADINPNRFIDANLTGLYPEKQYHRLYVGEILHCLVKKKDL